MTRVAVLIDSQVAARHMLRFAMELNGYRVAELEHASGTLAALAGACPGLLVLGIHPSDPGQQTLLSRVRQQPVLAVLPVLLVGENRFRPSWDLWTTGNCAWLDKPFRIGELHRVLDNLLAQAGLSLPWRTASRDMRHG